MTSFLRKKSFYDKVILIIFLFLINRNAFAECTKENIDYYLEKGFTTEQVTALCGRDLELKKKPDLYESFSDEYANEQDVEYVKRMRIERQVFFRASLGAQNVKLRRNELSFHLYECAREGLAKPGSDYNKKGCATIQVKVNLAAVTVSEKVFKEKIMFGNKSIMVEGDVETKIIGGFEGLSDYDASVLRKKVEARLIKKRGQALIPIKRGLDFNYAFETMQEIVAFHKESANGIKIGSDLGGKLNLDDLNIDSENDYIIEKEENKLRLTNDDDEAIVDGTLVFDDLSSPDQGNVSEIPESVFD
tara:strand:- start:189 stop:1100 length:912 start_codon:yes stop_codon:yes gene_type:complete